MSDSFNLARLDIGGEHFEVVVHPEQAMRFKKEGGDVRDALVYPKIFADAKKGMAASEQRLQVLFGTTDALGVAEQIIKKGSIQLTAEYRKQVLEQKRKRIIDIIHTNGVDPRTKAPHPVARIEAAMTEAKVRIDEYKPAEAQVEDVLKKLRVVMPITFAVKKIEIVIPAEHAGKAYGTVKRIAKVMKEKWQQDGSWKAVVEVPGGL